MDTSAANVQLWNVILQFGILSVALLVANSLRRKIPIIEKSLMPISVLAGFLLLILRSTGLLRLDLGMLEMMTYHGIAIGFIAMGLRIPQKGETDTADNLIAVRSGALIVSTYLVQALVGFAIVILLTNTFMPDLFQGAGILLPMGYGQGPGQANNVGTTYESLGFTGGRSFALAIAAAGYLCACIVGVIYLSILGKRRRKANAPVNDPNVDVFQDKNEIPISDSVDRFTVQLAMVFGVYLLTYLATWGITSGLAAISPALSNSVSSILWGFNFIVGSAFAMLVRTLMKKARDHRIITRQYQNNYLLNRISGYAFDIMIVAGIASIEIGDLEGLWVPFILMSAAGGVVTFLYLNVMCRRLYPAYRYESFLSMFGMLTGTISSGILLLREVDPEFRTPASNNLVTGSSTGILFGIPMLLFVTTAVKSMPMFYMTLGIVAVYLAFLLFVMLRWKGFRRHRKQ